jgi:type IX secretion system PorP/SprF family membrane protein
MLAQDPSFTQAFGNLIFNNPAYTGSSGKSRLQAGHRIQWSALQGGFITTNVASDFSFEKMPFDFGLIYTNDNAAGGTLIAQNIGLSLARSFTLHNELSLRLGCSGMLASRTLDPSLLTFGDQIDSRYGFIYTTQVVILNTTTRYINLNAGIVLHSKRFLIGYSASNLNQPNIGFDSQSTLAVRHTAQGSVLLFQKARGRNNGLYAHVFYAGQQGFQQVLPSLSYRFGKLKLGLGFRRGDATIGMIGYCGRNFTAGYSYDRTVSRLTNQTGGTHEFSLGIVIGRMNEKRPSMNWTSDLF